MATNQPKAREKKKRSPLHSFVELVVIVAVALGLALLIQALIVKPYRIPSPSMVPTLAIGQRVLVNRIGNNFSDPQIGDILVFHPPEGADLIPPVCGNEPLVGQPCGQPTANKAKVNFIKRVVGKPGDVISIRDGHVVRNGVLQKESYIRPCVANSAAECNFPRPIRVPPNHYFMMGDNRGESDDSRFWGPVNRDWIVGKAFFTYWPPKRIGFL